MKRILFLAVWIVAASLFAQDIPKNIILMIGDGMGVSQVTAGRVAKGELAMEQLDTVGLMTTHSLNKIVTDSAAAATAMGTGTKTRNGALGVDINNQPLETVAEIARDEGKAVGLVASCSITHATPAGFAVHVPSRNMDERIAEQIVEAEFDVLFAGGRAWFQPKSESGAADAMDKSPAGYGKMKESSGERTDGKDLLEELRKQMPVAETAEEFYKLGKTDRAAALLYSLHPPPAAQQSVSLADQTEKALEILFRDEDGFFLMVEGSQIDWAGHKNDGKWLVEEVVAFDDAVAVAAQFARENPDTLLIVTADHETGGFALHDGSIEEKAVYATGFSWGKHTGSMVPVFASGPGSTALGGVIDNTDLGRILKNYAGGNAAEDD
jgi:alkaline phosphatase